MTDREDVHRRICALRGQRGELDYEQGVWLLAAQRLRIHESLGLASFAEYAERFGGIDARQARERVRVAEALERLPAIAAALKSSELSWSAVRELTRVAVEEKETEWLDAARGRTVREIERMVARVREGDGPFDPGTAEPPRRLPYVVVAPTWALLQEARKTMIAEHGAGVTDDDFVATLARSFLARAAKGDDGAAAFSIAITTCDSCRTATQRGGADQVVVDAPTLERARCDCEELGRVDSVSPPKVARQIPPRIRRAVMRRHGGRCAVPGCCNAAFLELHHSQPRKDGGTHDPDLLLPLCSQHHQAAHEGALVIGGSWSAGFTFHHADGSRYGAAGPSPEIAARFARVFEALVAMGFADREAHAMIDRARPHVGPDASADEVLRAALRQAVVPGCAATHADDEDATTHVGREPAKSATKHAAPEGAATHVGREPGSASRAATMSTSEPVELADRETERGERAPDPPPSRSAALVSTEAKVFEALVAMGFKHREARAMIDRARPPTGPDRSAEEVLRAALGHAQLPRGIGAVRESGAQYARLAAPSQERQDNCGLSSQRAAVGGAWRRARQKTVGRERSARACSGQRVRATATANARHVRAA